MLLRDKNALEASEVFRLLCIERSVSHEKSLFDLISPFYIFDLMIQMNRSIPSELQHIQDCAKGNHDLLMASCLS